MTITVSHAFAKAMEKNIDEADAHFNLLREIEDSLVGLPEALWRFFKWPDRNGLENNLVFPARHVSLTVENWDKHIIQQRAFNHAIRLCMEGGQEQQRNAKLISCRREKDRYTVAIKIDDVKQELVFPFSENYFLDFRPPFADCAEFSALKKACQSFGGIQPCFAVQAEPREDGSLLRYPAVYIITNDRSPMAAQLDRFKEFGLMH